MELGAIKGRDGRGAIAHGRAEESAFSGRPHHDSGLLRTDVNRLIEERLDSPDGAANALQIGLDAEGSDGQRGKPHRDEVERDKLPAGDLLPDDKGGSVCEKARILIMLISNPVLLHMIRIPVLVCRPAWRR